MQNAIIDLLKENKYTEINSHLLTYFDFVKYQHINQYSLIIGSKDDNEEHLAQVIASFRAIVSHISSQLAVYEAIQNYKYIHKNEKMECYYKLRNSYDQTIEAIGSITKLSLRIFEQNKNIIAKRNDKKYSPLEISSKESFNYLIEQELKKIQSAKATIDFLQLKKWKNITSNAIKEEPNGFSIDYQIELSSSLKPIKPNYLLLLFKGNIEAIKTLLEEYSIVLLFFGIIMLSILYLLI